MQTTSIRQYVVQLFVACTLTIVLFGTRGWAQSILLSDSFENGTKSPDGWLQGANVPGVEYDYDRSHASEGSRSLGFKKTAQRYFPIAQWLRTVPFDVPATQLELSAQVRAIKATKAIIELQFLDGNQQFIGKEWVVYIGQKENLDPVASHDWIEYGGKADVPQGTKQIVVALQVYGPGSVWFDQLELREPGAINKTQSQTAAMKATSKENVASPTESATSPEPLQTPSGAWTRAVLIPPATSSPAPAKGYPLLVVLAGGDGSIDFHPFIRTIHENALKSEYAVVHLIAPPQVVWPTAQSRSRFATTQESIEAAIKHAKSKLTIDSSRILALGWSSSGPAIYESLLSEKTSLRGAIIAMSVFKPQDYPALSAIQGKRIFLLHSPEDSICPYKMALDARDKLSEAGGLLKLVDYSGGHGWNGPVFDNIRAGVEWLCE